MPRLIDLIRADHRIERHHPWPRAVVDGDTWRAAAHALADSGLSLLGLWGEPSRVHMAILDDRTSDIGVISLDCPDRQFPSVAAYHPPALRLERTLHDLFGLQATGTPDPRPWLDHGRWQTRFPLGERRDASADAAPYQFLPAEGDSLHQIAVGPVHAGIIEPGHFRFTASGETVVRLEQRLGYTHKGVEGLMTGSTIEQAARLAGRVSGDSTVAYGLAFAQAVEAAQRIAVPPRALLLRALMAELERLANHLGDIGAICNDASFALMQAHCAVLRESVLRAADAAFGHRLMRDLVVPGGVARDIAGDGADAIRAVLDRIRRHFPALVELYDNTASLQDRTVSTGIVPPALAKQFAAGGYVGRASGRDHDARRRPGYLPYDGLRFEVPVLGDGDVNARVWIRIREVEQSLALAYQILIGLEAGPVKVPLHNTAEPCEGMALVEGFRGDILAWLRLNGDRIERCHLRDPSWFQWPLLEAAIEGNIVADFPLCNKSFNCSYSGQDL
ncbi:Ni,Fe-hydrogenase III large subunit [Bradyrhizobium japonicum]|uniref:Ni,Fe-hydrogenase III large subunit n=1 Tax=Bradyrhizobium elkanii TaxID=29448 RepID=A0ABV4EVC6_BRAEL|nr:NADH-quinone oxidoreductase subunit C [Bradyrhizobium elkanii]MBP2428384.1 Ni,Fe-hydrogenase III large subunit [Bradyrhizobium elkanii]MCP1729398.1 Ni,Fe-hydrogenase III large subunit [Bradyrhizobium elkanii]MCP1756132.1 Ni,Fe-hydrogenase III large subunit [Bradyrhizobium elkanii]MCP1981647.1 Ni,Fe-hydrogenase III large subunit [Bradyrhizobium elkanii]MCS3573527.1 Ni,Fe-hydrogenase III large subunit [Bradyrhizobium elkanii]